MARGKANKPKQFEKLLTVMISGKPVTKMEVSKVLDSEIEVYRLSTYIWNCKMIAGAVIKSIKDGREVTAYQLMNVAEVQKYMDKVKERQVGATGAKTVVVDVPVVAAPVVVEKQVTANNKIESITDLGAKKKSKKVKEVVNLVVEEITDAASV